MKKLWTRVNEMKIRNTLKNPLYLTILIIRNGIFGGLCWALLGRYWLEGMEWFFCFVGYPAVFGGYIGGILYLFNHEFA